MTGGEQRVRVLTVLTFYAPHWTGLTKFAQRIAEGLVASGAEVTVLTSRHDPTLPATEVLDGVAVRRLSTRGRLSRTVLMPGFPAALIREVRRHDVVHLHSPMAEAGLVVAVCRLVGRPLVITHQGDVVMPTGAANQAVERLMRAMLAATFRRADRVVTHNDDYLHHSLTAVAGERAQAIEPPVPFEHAPSGAAERLRADEGIDSRPMVGFAGRWVEEKGFDVLLRAAPKVLAERPDTRFVFAGERTVAYEHFSERCASLADAIGPAFVDLGLLDDAGRLAAFYEAADVFVLPSRTDCHASVQIEAMLCGTPVVASDIPGARSVVQATGAGLLVPPEDSDALAQAILAVLGEPTQFDTELDTVPERYDPTLALHAYRAVIDDVVATPRHPRSGRPTLRDLVAPSPIETLLDGELDQAYRRRMSWAFDRLNLHPGERLLDAGAGLGSVTYVIERAAPDTDVIALDRDHDRLTRARHGGVDAPLARADLLQLPLASATFDAVLCSEVLEHLDHDAEALAELHRVLRPGGRLVVTVPHADYPWTWDPINRALERVGRPPIRSGPIVGIWTNHVRLYRPAELTALLTDAGFVVDLVEEQTHHALPFTHLALYGVGRGLVERGFLPTTLGTNRSGDSGMAGRVVGLARAALRRVDRRNDALSPHTRTFVSLVAAAHVPPDVVDA